MLLLIDNVIVAVNRYETSAMIKSSIGDKKIRNKIENIKRFRGNDNNK